MRHGKRFNHLGRTAPHRKAMLSNMASSLIEHKRITTTIAKAKELRKYIEPLLTKAKNDTTHSRRTVFSYLQSKEAVSELFNEVAQKIMDRPGGYTRIIKLGSRLGDNAEMCLIELVDYNELLLNTTEAPEKEKTRRSRRGGKKKEDGTETTEAKSKKETKTVEAAPVVEDAVVVEDTTEEPQDSAADNQDSNDSDNEEKKEQ
ncbi:MAG: 50S ribosomal protein L17 [Cyclobacteriaceae bacterium]|nr:50S ribosomal protein L17 [Cyclobacteriaceae bacterium]